jgi:hypothetical protein
MTRELVCPGCSRVLEVPDEPLAPTLTCPRCLAEVPDPRATAVTGQPAALERAVARDRQWVQAGLAAAALLALPAVLFGFYTFGASGANFGAIALAACLCFGLPVALGALVGVRGIRLLRAAYWVSGILLLFFALLIFFFVVCTGMVLQELRHL